MPDPVATSVERLAGEDIYISRLDAAIRSLGAAVAADTCVQDPARQLLLALLAAQRRSLLANEHLDDRGMHALVAARALLSLARTGDVSALHDHIRACAAKAPLLSWFLMALAAAASETPVAGDAARRSWPEVITLVLEVRAAEERASRADFFEEMELAALMPTPGAGDQGFLCWEGETEPVAWVDVHAWRPAIEAWLPLAAGSARCVDHLIALVRTLSEEEQASIGLPWVATIASGDLEAMVSGSGALPGWLNDSRAAAVRTGRLETWQQLVDSLLVAGETRLAAFVGE